MKIIDMSFEGNGIGKDNNKIVFVPKTVTGDDINYQTITEYKSYNIGKLESINKKSNLRIEAKCPYYEMCGGCNISNLTLIFQEIKKSAIDKVLQNKELNFPEGFVIERLIAKHFNEKIPSVEEHFKQIKEECSYSKERQVKKCKKICKIYNMFLDKLLLKSELFFKGEENERNN